MNATRGYVRWQMTVDSREPAISSALVVDSDFDAAAFQSSEISRLGATTRFCPSAASAVEAVRRERPDAVVVHLREGGISLLDVLKLALEPNVPELHLRAFPAEYHERLALQMAILDPSRNVRPGAVKVHESAWVSNGDAVNAAVA